MEILKTAVLLENEHQSDQKKSVTNDFHIYLTMYSFTQKRLCQWNAIKCSIKEDFTEIAASVFHRI